MKTNDKVRTPDNKIETVMEANDAQVVTFESNRRQAWYHPTKVCQVFWSETIKRYVTIPA